MGLLTSIVSGGGGGGGTAPTAPESVVVGSGSYTVPALKFAVVTCTVASSGGGYGYNAIVYSNTYVESSSSSSSNSSILSISQGDTITTGISNPTGNTTFAIYSIEVHRETFGSAFIYVNGSPVCIAYSSAVAAISNSINGAGNIARTVHTGAVGWIAQIYPV